MPCKQLKHADVPRALVWSQREPWPCGDVELQVAGDSSLNEYRRTKSEQNISMRVAISASSSLVIVHSP